MLSFVERCQSVLAGVILALLIASVVLVPQNRALADEGGDPVINECTPSGTPEGQGPNACSCKGRCVQGSTSWTCTAGTTTITINGEPVIVCACFCGGGGG